MDSRIGREGEIDEPCFGQMDLGLFSVGSRGADSKHIARIRIAVGLVLTESAAGTGVNEHSAHAKRRRGQEHPGGNEDYHDRFHD